MAWSIIDLPSEILLQVVLYLPSKNLPALEETCRRFYGLIGPHVWRKKCIEDYRYWARKRRFEATCEEDVDSVNWKEIFVARYTTDKRTLAALNSILGSQEDRIEKIQEMLSNGLDIKDCLLQQCKADVEKDDGLARR